MSESSLSSKESVVSGLQPVKHDTKLWTQHQFEKEIKVHILIQTSFIDTVIKRNLLNLKTHSTAFPSECCSLTIPLPPLHPPGKGILAFLILSEIFYLYLIP